MKHLAATILAASLFATVSAASTSAHAQFRASAGVGVAHLRTEGAESTSLQLRAEALMRTNAAVEVGFYAHHLERLDGPVAATGWGVGAVAALRPDLGAWSPMLYGSIGFQRTPLANGDDDAFAAEAGGGLVLRPAPIVDVDLRVGYAAVIGDARAQGFAATVLLSLHP